MKVAVVTVGAVLEWTGILLIASPELAPWLGRLDLLARRGLAPARSRLRRLFGRARSVYGRSSVSGGGAIRSEGRVGGATVRSTGLAVEERLAFLAEKLDRLERRLRSAELVLERLPGEWRQDVAAAEERLMAATDEKVAAVRDAHLRIRLTGVAFVLAGLPLLAWANFL